MGIQISEQEDAEVHVIQNKSDTTERITLSLPGTQQWSMGAQHSTSAGECALKGWALLGQCRPEP